MVTPIKTIIITSLAVDDLHNRIECFTWVMPPFTSLPTETMTACKTLKIAFLSFDSFIIYLWFCWNGLKLWLYIPASSTQNWPDVFYRIVFIYFAFWVVYVHCHFWKLIDHIKLPLFPVEETTIIFTYLFQHSSFGPQRAEMARGIIMSKV